MRFTSSIKQYFTAALCVCGLSVILQSCSKNAEPEPVVVKSAAVTKSGIDVPLYTGNTNGSGTTVGSSKPGGSNTGNGGSTGGNNGGSTGGSNGGGTTDGSITISSEGNGGVAIGDGNTIIFTIKGTTFTLKNSSNYNVLATSISLFGINSTNITGAGADDNSVTFALMTMGGAVGVMDLSQATIQLVDGTTYNLGTAGKINYNTFSTSNMKATTKGTFDLVMVNDKDANDKVRVSGSFNLL